MIVDAFPAYGRDYKSQKAVLADWKAGKDFQDAASGRYLNLADAVKYGIAWVNVRYGAGGAKLAVIRVGK